MADEWELPDTVETQSIERLGGGFAWESAVHDCNIKMVYMDQAESGAVSFNLELTNAAGKTLKERLWIKSGNVKGNKTYYTKDGKNYPLPGYSVADSLCIAATGNHLKTCMETVEKKAVQVYDSKEGKEVQKTRPVVMSLIGKAVKVAVHNITEDKRKKNDATGDYEPTGETRTINECKFFGNMDGKTAEEISSGADATFFDKWAEKNTGVTIDKTSKNAGQASAAAIMGGGTNSAKPASTMFDK